VTSLSADRRWWRTAVSAFLPAFVLVCAYATPLFCCHYLYHHVCACIYHRAPAWPRAGSLLSRCTHADNGNITDRRGAWTVADVRLNTAIDRTSAYRELLRVLAGGGANATGFLPSPYYYACCAHGRCVPRVARQAFVLVLLPLPSFHILCSFITSFWCGGRPWQTCGRMATRGRTADCLPYCHRPRAITPLTCACNRLPY